jgi:cysteine desulfurase / selenocysteine lyase
VIYLDNAATSCPKPAQVVAAVCSTLETVCANPGRGAYDAALEAGRVLLRTRRSLARLIGAPDPARIVFALNATHALNLALKGLLWGGGHVVISPLEHNAVVRPLAALADRGVEVTRVRCGADGSIDPDDVLAALRPDTRLVALTHASNVLGTVLPIEQVGPRLRERGVPFLVDAAQTAGSMQIDVTAMGIDLLALPGHKGLQGPQGVGALYVGDDMGLHTLVEGGAGGDSASPEPPEELPDRYEAGTPNTPGIAGLGAGVELVLAEGVETIGERERMLADRLRRGLAEVEAVRLHGPAAGTPAAPVASISVEGISSGELAFILDRAFGIAVRAGLHCAPEAHRVSKSLDDGLVRFSLGRATTEEDVEAALEAVAEITVKTRGG